MELEHSFTIERKSGWYQRTIWRCVWSRL